MQRSSDTKTSNRLPDAPPPESIEPHQSHREPFALVLAEPVPPAEHVYLPVAGLIGSRGDEKRRLGRVRHDRPRGDVQRLCHSQRSYAVPDGHGAALATMPRQPGHATSDDTTKTSPPDAEFISLTEAYDIAYGTKKFGVSDDHLAE